MVVRGLLALGAAAVAAGLVAAFAPLFRPGAVVPAVAVACATLAAMGTLPGDVRKRLGWLLLPPGVVSLGATTHVLVTGTGSNEPAAGTTLEVAALLLILIHVTRWNTGWSLPVITVVTAAAQVLWLLRYMPGASWLTQALGCVFWGLGAAVAIVFGAYPRWAAARLQDTVASAREAQQRQLERDLHDYVAHDLSGMIVQAQAARYSADGDPTALAAALQRIEEAGQRAMSSMDRALSLLRPQDPDGDAVLTRHPGLDELSALVHRFEEGTRAHTALAVHGSPATVPREVGEVLYRAASEALTNVHRHAGPSVASVAITLDAATREARIVIEDRRRELAPRPAPRKNGGTGLSQLRSRIEALGGELTAGPTTTGWRLSVRIPYAPAT